LLGWLELGDQVRATSQHAVRILQFQRKRIGLLTGDAQGVASSVAQELGITEIFAEVLPHQKADLIASLQADTSKVVVVGDAENDLPALQQADVSVAFGVESNQPVEAAGLSVFGHDPAQFAQAVVISAEAAKVTKRSLTWSAIYAVVSLPLAAGAFDFIGLELSPAIAVALSLTVSTATLFGIRSLRKA
jgi:Cu2+-exporting ATPase